MFERGLELENESGEGCPQSTGGGGLRRGPFAETIRTRLCHTPTPQRTAEGGCATQTGAALKTAALHLNLKAKLTERYRQGGLRNRSTGIALRKRSGLVWRFRFAEKSLLFGRGQNSFVQKLIANLADAVDFVLHRCRQRVVTHEDVS